MTQLIPNGKQQFTDLIGRPLLGGKVYFYQVGTQTPKNTYKDAAETVLNTNPVVLDARGSASIYGTGAYRQVLRDAFGGLIWDQVITDPVSSLRDEIAGPGGSKFIGYTRQPLTENISDVQKMLDAQAISPWEFAYLITSKPDLENPATWDWAPAFQAAISSNRKYVIVKDGVYLIGSGLLVSSNTTILLEGGATIRRKPGSGAFDMVVGAAGASNILIYGSGVIDGNKDSDGLSPTNAGDRFCGIKFVNILESSIKGIRVIGTVNNETGGAIYLEGASDVLVESTVTTNNDRTGVVVIRCNRCKIVRNLAYTNVGSGVTSSDNVDCEYIGNVTYDNGNSSTTKYTGLNASGLRSRVIGNLSYKNGASGINVGEATHSSDESVLSGNESYQNGIDGISIQNSTRVIASDNVCRVNTRDGIRLFTGSTNCDLNNNALIGNLGTGAFVTLAGHSIKGNRTARNNSAGIYLETNSTICMVIGNISHGNGVLAAANASGIIVQGSGHTINDNRSNDDGTGVQQYGLWMAGATNANVVGNTLSGNVTAAIRESGSPTYATRGNRCGNDQVQGIFTATASSSTTVVPNTNVTGRSLTRVTIQPFNAAAAARPAFVSATVVGTSFTVTFASPSVGTEIYTYQID